MSTGTIFLSCDWGTSSFRLRLVEVSSLTVIAEVSNSNGIASTFDAWKKAALSEDNRLSFYKSMLLKQIRTIEEETGDCLAGIPVIVSGMASSTLGMLELPYKQLPFLTDGSDLEVHPIEASNDFLHDIIIVSGVRSDDDVIRGEEVQVVGSITDEFAGQQLFIIPGTHSKHIKVVNGLFVGFQTFMTGELFNLLSTKSILAKSIEKASSILDDNNKASFVEGVNDSTLLNPLHAFFLVRTNALFNKMTKQENYFYLSGLLIGLELNGLDQKDFKVTLLADEVLQAYYEVALESLGFANRVTIRDVNQAVLQGHFKIYCEQIVTKNLSTDHAR